MFDVDFDVRVLQLLSGDLSMDDFSEEEQKFLKRAMRIALIEYLQSLIGSQWESDFLVLKYIIYRNFLLRFRNM